MEIGIHSLSPAEGSIRKRKRVGRGIGSGRGKTSGRGSNGNKARGYINPNFEGGQTPLHRRLPQIRGFKPVNKKHYSLINLRELEENFADGAEIDADVLIELGIVRDLQDGLKVLGDGELTKKLTVRAKRFSKSAAEKIVAAGGTAELVAGGK